MKIGSIVIDCSEFGKMLTFWQEALHYVPREPAKDGWVVLRDPEGRNPNVSLNKDPEKRLGRNRWHLDLYTDNREDEVKRLLKIGATAPSGSSLNRHSHCHPQTFEPDFIVLEDPDGNLFCVVQKDTS